MAGITLEQAQEHLAKWLDADLKVAKGQSVSIGSKSLTRVNAGEIKTQIIYWERICLRLQNNRRGPKVRGITPV